ncbi:hypothetical protein [Companilactobacillus furfuricola]|uniref:hypothetical protein n=1 Tax=Companilactobacillus furfuricola TaxID=1462575 RepID=UPI000F7880D7|nr:hypothetical protein [Companilactobacillus furfuricola]
MKKIKYVGITAATLLAVAPVIGESVENTTAVHAATTENTNNQITDNTAISNVNDANNATTANGNIPVSTYGFLGNVLGNAVHAVSNGFKNEKNKIEKEAIHEAAKEVTHEASHALTGPSKERIAAEKVLNAMPNTVTYDNGNLCPNFGILANSFGTKLNAEAFEKLNKSFPITALGFPESTVQTIDDFLAFRPFLGLSPIRGKIIFGAGVDKATLIDQALKTYYRGDGAKFDLPIKIVNYQDELVAQKTITFTNNANYKNPVAPHITVTQLGINYADNMAVPAEMDTSELKSEDNANVVAIDQNGTPVPFTTSVGDLYYSQQSAFSQSGKTYDEDKLPKTDATLFQPITITFDKASSGVDLQKINDSMKQTAQKKGISIKDLINQLISLGSKFTGMGAGMGAQQDPSATQKVNAISVNGGTFTQFQSYPDYTNNSITFIRMLKVTPKVDPNKKPDVDPDHVNDAENWDVTPTSGTLNVGGRNADLVDDNGKPDNRELGAGTPWITDQYRVNKITKEGQYRVSTHEWVSEKDVTFKQIQGNQASSTAFTSIVDIHPGTLHLSGKPVFKLYKKDGKQSNRSLAGNTDWYTDKIGYGKDGSQYYRLSTDEWVKLTSGVQFK